MNTINDERYTALTYAITMGNKECMTILIEKGADMNRYYHGLSLPLIYAVTNNFEDLVSVLVEAEADVNKEDTFSSSTPLTTAI